MARWMDTVMIGRLLWWRKKVSPDHSFMDTDMGHLVAF